MLSLHTILDEILPNLPFKFRSEAASNFNCINDTDSVVIVRHEKLLEDALSLISQMFPTAKTGDIELVQCTDGITNKLVKCTFKPDNTTFLIRAYGKKSEVLIDRQQELIVSIDVCFPVVILYFSSHNPPLFKLQNIVILSSLGLSPPLLARFTNGFVYGFVPGSVFTVDDMSHPQKSKLVAQTLALWHATVSVPSNEGNSTPQPQLFPTLKKWIAAVPSSTGYSNPIVNTKFQTLFNMRKLSDDLTTLESRLEAQNSPTVFCHNDLLSANIILSPTTTSASFIDFEYGGYNYQAFDIANHFCEFAGFECDYSKWPSREFQEEWIGEYLIHYRKYKCEESQGRLGEYTERERGR